jgi:aspartate kinase
MHVLKFGGSCLTDDRDLDHISRCISECDGDAVVVLSAIRGVTDDLVRILEVAESDGLSEPDRAAFVEGFRARHMSFSPTLIENQGLIDDMDDLLALLDSDLMQISSKFNSASNDSATIRILAAGERASIIAVAAGLRDCGLLVTPVRSEDAGIRLRVSEAHTQIDLDATRAALSLPTNSIPLCTGWYGMDTYGSLALLGRGGSDCTATALATILSAEAVTIWRDTPGVLAIDPSWRLPGRRLGYLSYSEALQLATTSDSLLHPDAIEPLIDLGIPLYVRPLRSNEPGTLIGPSIVINPPRIRAIACRRGLTEVLWRVHSGRGLSRTLGALSRALHHRRVRVWSLRGDSHGIRVLTDEKDVIRIGAAIRDFDGRAAIEPSEPLALLTFIGESLGKAKNMDKEILRVAHEAGIRLRPLSRELSEHGCDMLLSESDAGRAVPALTEAFGLLEA